MLLDEQSGNRLGSGSRSKREGESVMQFERESGWWEGGRQGGVVL